jgi:CDP-glucose 4,6-dehydratase
MKLHKNQKFIDMSWNFGPDKSNNKSVKDIIYLINKEFNNSARVIKKNSSSNKYYESKVLMLNSDKSKKTLNWRPKYNLAESIKLISFWHKEFLAKRNLLTISQKQILDYFK